MKHSWKLAFMALLVQDEFTGLNIDKVIRMCLIHDPGEAFTDLKKKKCFCVLKRSVTGKHAVTDLLSLVSYYFTFFMV
ncbi:MAG: HD domain-containing protein [Oliverpabstia sp.]